MTKLLVSVRDTEEAREAAAGGAHVIDVKEPSRGSLGAATPDERIAVRRVLAEQVPLSAALGELLEQPERPSWPCLDGYSFAKVGLAGCAGVADWPERWRDWSSHLPPPVAAVAVIYADFAQAGAPEPMKIVDVAHTSARVLLLDTFDKSRGTLLDHFLPAELDRVIAAARGSSMRIALAGSVTEQLVPQFLAYEPDLVAVRGAACREGRMGAIDSARVRRLTQRLSSSSASFLHHEWSTASANISRECTLGDDI